MNDNNYEQYPGFKVESVGEREVAPSEDFEKSFETGVPPFAGEQGGEVQYGQATAENLYYGEAKDDEEVKQGEAENKRDEGIAAAGMAVDLLGNPRVDDVMLRKIYEFNVDGSKNPILELKQMLGIAGDQSEDLTGEYELESSENAPIEMERSFEGDRLAIKFLQELIGEVLNADVDYSELRASGHGVVEQAGRENEERGVEASRATNLAEILQGWAEYKKGKIESDKIEEETDEIREEEAVEENNEEKVNETGEFGETEETEEEEQELSGEKKQGLLDEEERKPSGEKEQDLPSEDEQRETLNPEILQKQM